MKPDEIIERYGQPKDGFSVVVTKGKFNTYVSIDEMRDGEWRHVKGTARGMGDRPYADLVDSLFREAKDTGKYLSRG